MGKKLQDGNAGNRVAEILVDAAHTLMLETDELRAAIDAASLGLIRKTPALANLISGEETLRVNFLDTLDEAYQRLAQLQAARIIAGDLTVLDTPVLVSSATTSGFHPNQITGGLREAWHLDAFENVPTSGQLTAIPTGFTKTVVTKGEDAMAWLQALMQITRSVDMELSAVADQVGLNRSRSYGLIASLENQLRRMLSWLGLSEEEMIPGPEHPIVNWLLTKLLKPGFGRSKWTAIFTVTQGIAWADGNPFDPRLVPSYGPMSTSYPTVEMQRWLELVAAANGDKSLRGQNLAEYGQMAGVVRPHAAVKTCAVWARQLVKDLELTSVPWPQTDEVAYFLSSPNAMGLTDFWRAFFNALAGYSIVDLEKALDLSKLQPKRSVGKKISFQIDLSDSCLVTTLDENNQGHTE